MKRFKSYQLLLVSLIVALIVTGVISSMINDFYAQKVQEHLQEVQKNFQEAQKNVITEYIQSKKEESEFSLNQIMLPLEKANKQLKPDLKSALKKDTIRAYKLANEIYKKYSKTKNKKELQDCIIEALSRMPFHNKNSSIFIKDYKFNTLLDADVTSENKEHRDIDLEAMQKVRKYKEGYLEYVSLSNEEQMLYVKNLDFYDWYIGVTSNVHRAQKELQENLLQSIKKTSLDKDEFLGVLQKKDILFLTKKLDIDVKNLTQVGEWHQLKDSYYYTKYYKPFAWYLMYGFDAESMIAKIKEQQKEQKLTLEKEFSFFK